jgi:hypothetical protein
MFRVTAISKIMLVFVIWSVCNLCAAHASTADRAAFFYPQRQRTIVTTKQKEYCGSPAGSRHYDGIYHLRLGQYTTTVTASFDDGTPHDKRIYEVRLSDNKRLRFFAYYQYSSCNHEAIFVRRFLEGRGFDPQPLQFCNLSATNDKTCEDHARQFITSALSPTAKNGLIVTISYSQLSGVFTHIVWKYDAKAAELRAVKTWTTETAQP